MRTVLLATILVPALALSQAFPMKRKLKVGEVFKYRLTVVFRIAGNDIFYTSIDTQKVTSVARDGSYTVQSTQSDIRSTNSGADLQIAKDEPPTDTSYSARGQVVAIAGQQAASAWRIADMSCFILPDKAINKGDTWTYTIPPRADLQTAGGVYNFAFEGPEPEKVDDFSVLRVAEDYKENTQFNKATSTGTIFVDPTDGSVVKLDEEWRTAPIHGVNTQVNGHVSYERIP